MAGNEEQDEVNDSHSSAEISGSIQDRLIYALAVVHDLKDEDPPEYIADVDVSEAQNHAELVAVLAELISTRDDLATNRDLIINDWDEWSSLIKKLDKNARTLEAQSYKDFAATNQLTNTLTEAAARITKLNRAINKLTKEQKLLEISMRAHSPAPASPVPGAGHAPRHGHALSTAVKIPKPPPLEFSGDMEAWGEFIQSFNRVIHNNDDFAIIDKFHCLKLYLKPPASDLLIGIPVDEANYEMALDVLKNKYDRPDRLIDHLNDKLVNLKPVQKIGELKSFVTEFEKICKLLESKRVNVKNNSLIEKTARCKLPTRIREKIHEAKRCNPA